MDRRAFVLGSLTTLSGCSAFPPDRQYPAEYYKPQLLFEWTWDPDAEELEVEVVAGNPLTAENTAWLAVDGYGLDEPVYWAARDARGRFPVKPGDSLTVTTEPHGDVRIVWSDGEGRRTSIDVFRFPRETTEGDRR